MDDPIDKLTAAMAAGDAAAVAAFYRRYFSKLYEFARRATRRDEALCLDIVQESVLRILRTVRPVASERQFLAWLKLVVQTTAYDRLKSDRRRVRREELVAVPPDNTFHHDEPADDEQLAWLKAELDALDPEIARMIEMRFERKWTLARIGGVFGLSAGSVDGRLRRAIRTLREKAAKAF